MGQTISLDKMVQMGDLLAETQGWEGCGALVSIGAALGVFGKKLGTGVFGNIFNKFTFFVCKNQEFFGATVKIVYP